MRKLGEVFQVPDEYRMNHDRSCPPGHVIGKASAKKPSVVWFTPALAGRGHFIFGPIPALKRRPIFTSSLRDEYATQTGSECFQGQPVSPYPRPTGRMPVLPIFLMLFVLLGLSNICPADQVAVFDVQWGKGKQRQVRSFTIELAPAAAAYTVYNFKKLVRDGFYLKTTIHRVIPNYLVQGGDPLSQSKDRDNVGTGGPGYTLPAEIRLRHLRGSIAMGRLPDPVNLKRVSNGSQFYICLRAIPEQDGKDTVFGRVLSGMPALEEISRLPTDTNSYPVNRVWVTRTYLIDRALL
jgi:peptidyl-prolyl cis-trans isomerase B (cyclophilin B)